MKGMKGYPPRNFKNEVNIKQESILKHIPMLKTDLKVTKKKFVSDLETDMTKKSDQMDTVEKVTIPKLSDQNNELKICRKI